MTPGKFRKADSKLAAIDIGAYLKRLHVAKETPSLKYLNQLHRAHLLAIPFENLDIHYNKRIELKVNTIAKKVLVKKRGGFCYELNGLFYHLLRHLGFRCWLGSAEVKNDHGWSPDFDHMIIFLELAQQLYLVDVGFGALFSQPKLIKTYNPQVDFTSYFRFSQDPDSRYILEQSQDNAYYLPKYRFVLEDKGFIQFLERCNYHQDAINSHFKQGKLITQLFHNGRITLTDRELKLHLNGEKEIIPISNEDEFLSKLEHHFGVDSRGLIF